MVDRSSGLFPLLIGYDDNTYLELALRSHLPGVTSWQGQYTLMQLKSRV